MGCSLLTGWWGWNFRLPIWPLWQPRGEWCLAPIGWKWDFWSLHYAWHHLGWKREGNLVRSHSYTTQGLIIAAADGSSTSTLSLLWYWRAKGGGPFYYWLGVKAQDPHVASTDTIEGPPYHQAGMKNPNSSLSIPWSIPLEVRGATLQLGGSGTLGSPPKARWQEQGGTRVSFCVVWQGKAGTI